MPLDRTGEVESARGRRDGFSLIEILVAVALVSIMAGALAPIATQQIRSGRIQATHERMDVLLEAMVGEASRGSFGYLGEMGALPPALEDLNDATGKPAYAIDATDGVGYGFGGPYAPVVAAPGAVVVDTWSIPFQYDGVTAQLTSAGADRQLGTADDLVRPINPLPTAGNLVVTVMGVPNTGPPAVQLAAADVDVFLASAVGGVRNDVLMAGTGPFTASALHLGHHGLRAVGTGSYAGAAVVRDVVTVQRGTSRHTLVLEQP